LSEFRNPRLARNSAKNSSARIRLREFAKEEGRRKASKQARAAGSVEISPKSENKIQKFENEVILQGFNRQN
jgi:hypothetical protein